MKNKFPFHLNKNVTTAQYLLFSAETLNNGSLSLSPPHIISQRENLQVMQPASAPGSPPSSPCLSPIGPIGTLDPNWQATKPTVSRTL